MIGTSNFWEIPDADPDGVGVARYNCTIWGWRWGLRPGPRDETTTDWNYMPTNKFLIYNYYDDASQPQTLQFCEEIDPVLEPATIDFCDILNNNDITCPPEDRNEDICIMIWRQEYPTENEDWFDRLCSMFVIRSKQ